MERDCPVSCKICKEICADYACSQECSTRAAAGECLSNPEYMLTRCKKTCQYCDRCTNLHTACPYQAASCSDTTQIPKMYFYCRPTCGLCSMFFGKIETKCLAQITNCNSTLDPTTQKCPRDTVYNPFSGKCLWVCTSVAAKLELDPFQIR